MRILFLILCVYVSATAFAQESINEGIVTVYKDPRIDLLSKIQTRANYGKYYGPKAAKGYRLMILSTNDRDFAMKVRAQLLQRFPNQKVYMTFQVPNIRIKFGNFTDKDEAEKYKKLITAGKIVTNNIYVVPEIVEVKNTNKGKLSSDD